MAEFATGPSIDALSPIDAWYAYVQLGPYAIERVRQAAMRARHYAGKQVGAVVLALSESGGTVLFDGANQNLYPGENPTKKCAEMDALEQMQEHGFHRLKGLWVTGNVQPDTHSGVLSPTLHPCGNCRQFMKTSSGIEIDTDALVTTVHPDLDEYEFYTLSELISIHEGTDGHLPLAFSHHVDPGFRIWEAGRLAYGFYRNNPQEYGNLAPAQVARLAVTGQLGKR